MSQQSVLLISRSAPYGSNGAREFLDIALAASVFDCPISLLLLDDGVFQLLKNQQPQAVGQKNLNAVQSSLPLYDIDAIHVSQSSLTQRGLDANNLVDNARVIDNTEISRMIHQHDVVLTV